MVGRPTIAVIPARHHATRFPGKPLALIDGVPMIVRVARRVRSASAVDEVWVATDDPRIADAVRAVRGVKPVMTDVHLRSGTDRVAQAVQRSDERPGLVVNVQGDEPLIDPDDLDQLVAAAQARPDGISTLARAAGPDEDATDPHLVKVVVAGDGRAMYFSRARVPAGGATIVHVGVYAYPPAVLHRFAAMAPTELEATERLEQLRALELGIPIYVTMRRAAAPVIGVDVPADVGRVEAVLRGAARDRGTI